MSNLQPGQGLGKTASALLAGGLGSGEGEITLIVQSLNHAQSIDNVNLVPIEIKRRKGSPRGFKKSTREPTFVIQIREEDEEILGIISEFLFLEAA